MDGCHRYQVPNPRAIEIDHGPMFRPVGKPRVAEEIVQQLRGLILRGEYAVGDKLPPERKLAEELGVNRASLREAIK